MTLKQRRAEARAKGMCSTCVTKRAVPGHKTCQGCLDLRASRRLSMKRQSRAAIPANLAWLGELGRP